MKKLSLSLIALLAVVFAVSSAFTSAERTLDKLFVNTNNVANPTASDFDEYFGGEEQAYQDCVPDPEDPICIAKFEEDSLIPGQPESTLTVKDDFVILGIYQP